MFAGQGCDPLASGVLARDEAFQIGVRPFRHVHQRIASGSGRHEAVPVESGQKVDKSGQIMGSCRSLPASSRMARVTCGLMSRAARADRYSQMDERRSDYYGGPGTA